VLLLWSACVQQKRKQVFSLVDSMMHEDRV